MRELSVSLDALAALAERTRPRDPDLVAAATLAELAGAESIRVGVSEGFRGVREQDLRDLRRVTRRLELRMTPALIKVALETQPNRALLASEAREVDGRAGGLDRRAWGGALNSTVRMLVDAGIEVCVLVAPDLESVKAAHSASASGVELDTGSIVDLPPAERAGELERLSNASRLAAKLGMGVSLSGGLGYRSVREMLESVPAASRLTVGRAWTWRSALVGVDRATRDLLGLIG